MLQPATWQGMSTGIKLTELCYVMGRVCDATFFFSFFPLHFQHSWYASVFCMFMLLQTQTVYQISPVSNTASSGKKRSLSGLVTAPVSNTSVIQSSNSLWFDCFVRSEAVKQTFAATAFDTDQDRKELCNSVCPELLLEKKK